MGFLLSLCLDCNSSGVCPNIKDCPLCYNGGSCLDVIDGYNCQCMSGYTSVHCEKNIDECQGIECQVSEATFDQMSLMVNRASVLRILLREQSFSHDYAFKAV